MSIQQDKENNMNLWKFIEKILDFILYFNFSDSI